MSNVVKVSEEDPAWYFPDAAPEDMARRWAAAASALSVDQLRWAARWAANAAAIAVERPGADPPTREESEGVSGLPAAGLMRPRQDC